MKSLLTGILAAACAGPGVGAAAQQRAVEDDPAAHALYDKMIGALRAAKTLSLRSRYRWAAKGRELGRSTYELRMKKPNYFRLETVRADGKKGGVLIGDGETMWLYWPNGRPFFSTEEPATYGESRTHQYMETPAPVGRHSIAHQTGLLGAGMSMTVIDPSTFHGYTDSLQRHLDGVKSEGTARIGGETCDVILVSIMKGQRTWRLWLARQDHLPRKLRQVVHVSYDIITEERWSDVKVDGDIPTRIFAWSPPAGWTRWFKPSLAARLLKPGTRAPDFALTLLGSRQKANLADHRGKVVWLNIWRVG